MSDQSEEKTMGTESANVADGQVLEGNKPAAHTKLKSRHLYMIAMGGKSTHWTGSPNPKS